MIISYYDHLLLSRFAFKRFTSTIWNIESIRISLLVRYSMNEDSLQSSWVTSTRPMIFISLCNVRTFYDCFRHLLFGAHISLSCSLDTSSSRLFLANKGANSVLLLDNDRDKIFIFQWIFLYLYMGTYTKNWFYISDIDQWFHSQTKTTE